MNRENRETDRKRAGFDQQLIEKLELPKHIEQVMLAFMLHDLLPWEDDEPGLSVPEIRRRLKGLGLALTDRQIQYCLRQSAEVLWMDKETMPGARAGWKRLNPESLCTLLKPELRPIPDLPSDIQLAQR